MNVRWSGRLPFAVLVLAVQVTSATAQAGPPCGPDLPIKCTPGKDAAILLGFVGAGIVAAYLGYRLNHPRHELSIVGCTAQADGVMTLVEDKTGDVYSLTPVRKRVRAGERVVLRGKMNADSSGKKDFQVMKIVKNDGPCETRSPSAVQDDGL